MNQRTWCGALFVLVSTACGGASGPGQAQPAAAPSETVTSFLQAVADSNLTKMAQLWGSSKGSAAATGQPSDYQKRIVLMQSYLRHDESRIASDIAESSSQHSMQVELRRVACTWVVPFTVVKADKGWLVSNIDLTHAGNPVRPCDPDAKAAPDTTQKN